MLFRSARTVTHNSAVDSFPTINYAKTYPSTHRYANLPILLMKQGNEIVHSDLTAIIAGPAPSYLLSGMTSTKTYPDRNQPFREFTIIFHDEIGAVQAFDIIESTAHPNVRVDFDIYHLQLSEGNIINNLGLGLDKEWIRLVQVGDVPGRLEPGTGELNYSNIYRVLREKKYAGIVDSEHGTSSTPEHAIAVVKKLAAETS